MSAVSLMPISKKIKLTKYVKFNVRRYGSFLGDSRTILREAGIANGGWPRVKITVYPETRRCQILD